MHTNMFAQGHSRAEVKEAMNADQKRESRAIQITDLVFGVCLGFLVRHMEPWDAVAVFVGALTALSGLRRFVDQSVRNFFLHRLDWEDAERRG